MLCLEKDLQTLPTGYFSCNENTIQLLPVFSATAERSFSTLRLIKSDLRITMGQVRLDGLCLNIYPK